MENDGKGHFELAFGIGTQAQTYSIAAADYDGDGDLDAWVANISTQPNRVWINDGLGNFSRFDK